ncbi:MAG: T9SS type A sorting domain-containing protein [Ignavibacteria bacterium]|nr:T9SS type A sorting domain-containing protein [Ignavibacteria bacterium]
MLTKIKIAIIITVVCVCSSSLYAQTWEKIDMHFPQSDTLLSNSTISFATKNTGWICTSGSLDTIRPPHVYSTKIFKTTDGGNNWTLQHSADVMGGGYVFALDSLHCWAYGGTGLLFTSDGGSKWEIYNMPIYGINFPYFFDENNGIAMSTLQPWFTTDGGGSWTPTDTSLINLRYLDITFMNNKMGWIVSDISPFSTDAGSIAQTLDGGKTWRYQDTLTAIMFGIEFVDSLNGFAVGTNVRFSTGFIYSTTNGGKQWTYKQDYNSGPMLDVGFLNSKNGWIIGRTGRIWNTTDGGVKWILQNLNTNATFRKIIVLRKDEVAYIFGGSSYGYSSYQYPFDLFYADLSSIISVKEQNAENPKFFLLSQNYPNPFNPTTQIQYILPSISNVIVTVYNSLGQTVKVFNEGTKEAGNYSITFNGEGLSSGIYLYSVHSVSIDGKQNFTAAKKMLLIR